MQTDRFRQMDQRGISRSRANYKSRRDVRSPSPGRSRRKRNRRILILDLRSIMRIGCLLATFVIISGCARRAAAPGTWTTDNNQRATLADYKGKVVLLDFYATWCEPCRRETPHLITLHQKYGSQGLEIIGLNVGGEDDQGQVPEYQRDYGIEYLLAIPDDELVEQLLGDNENIPQTVLINRQGQLIRHMVGFSEARVPELDRLISSE